MMDDNRDGWPLIRLHPEDAQSVRLAGSEFARSLVGAPSVLFMLALGEQTGIVRDGIRKAGFAKRQARLAATAFENAARCEWRRIASATQHETHGTA